MKVDRNRIYLEAIETSRRRHAKYNLYTSLTHHYLMVDQTSRRLIVTSDDERDIPAIAVWQVFLYRVILDALKNSVHSFIWSPLLALTLLILSVFSLNTARNLWR